MYVYPFFREHTIDFHGDGLRADAREREKLRGVIETISDFLPDRPPGEPYPGYLELRINGETIGSLGKKEGADTEQEVTEGWPSSQELYEHRTRQLRHDLDELVYVMEHKGTITSHGAARHLIARAIYLKEKVSEIERASYNPHPSSALRALDNIVSEYQGLRVDFNLAELPLDFPVTGKDAQRETLRNLLADLRFASTRLTQLGFMTAEENARNQTLFRNREPKGTWQASFSGKTEDLDETRMMILETEADFRNRFARITTNPRSLTPSDIFMFHDAIGSPLEPPSDNPPSLEPSEISNELLSPPYPPPPCAIE